MHHSERPEEVPQPRPQPVPGVAMDLADAVSVLIPRPLVAVFRGGSILPNRHSIFLMSCGRHTAEARGSGSDPWLFTDRPDAPNDCPATGPGASASSGRPPSRAGCARVCSGGRSHRPL